MPTRKIVIATDPQVISYPPIFAKAASITLLVRCYTCQQEVSINLKNYWKFRKGTTAPWSCYTCRKPEIDAAAKLNPLYSNPEYRAKFAELHNNPDYRLAVHNKEVADKIAATTKRLWKDPKTRAKHLAHRQTDTYRKRISEWSRKYWESHHPIDQQQRISDFLAKANQIHDGKFDYSKSLYTVTTAAIEIQCTDCSGIFTQLPITHLRGSHCPHCTPPTTSTGQREIHEFISGLTTETKILNDRTVISPHEIDIYLPDRKLGIEYHGIYWHSYDRPETKAEKQRHQEKFIKANHAGIKLLQFCDFEWRLKRAIVESMIANRFGLSNRLHARKLAIAEMGDKEASLFFETNHLSGHRSSKWCWCLVDDSGPVAAMSFNSCGQNQIEIMRLATRLGYTVRGGAGKLLAAAIAAIRPKSILTFADLRYSTGNVYKQIGFIESHYTTPGYFYHLNGKIRSRLQCQKHKLSALLPQFDGRLSESSNMFINGYRRFWDAGNVKLKLDL